MIRPDAIYKHQAFAAGLRRHGFTVIDKPLPCPKPDDVLVIWNRYSRYEQMAKAYERCGAKVFVAENGYIGKTKAMALGHHSGAGQWIEGAEDRWAKLGIELDPWRTDGEHILVLPQRGMGERGVAMPRHWLAGTLRRLEKATRRPVIVRRHPGQDRNARPIEEDLRGAWAAVVWGSGAGIKAIRAGIPVFHDLASWIGAPAASCNLDIESPFLGDRLPMFKRLSWAQWELDEIASGEAFSCYL
jgi:hypothetical protein